MDDRELAKRLDSIEDKIDELLQILIEEEENDINEDEEEKKEIRTRERSKDYT